MTWRTKSFMSFSTWMMSNSGFTISVPPKSASKSSMAFMASSRYSSVQGTLVLNMRLKLEPKLMTLKREDSGSDLRKRMREFLACRMRYPPIDPDRSSRKMYSPAQCSKLDLAGLGGKKVRLTHSFPSVHRGRPKSICSKVNSRSFSGGTAPPLSEQVRKWSVKMVSSSWWEDEWAERMGLELNRLILKSISVLPSTKVSLTSGSVSASFLKRDAMRSIWVWQRGEMWEGMRTVHFPGSSLASLPTRSNSIRTLSSACRLPRRTLSTDFSEAELTAIITVLPFSLAYLYSALTTLLSLTTPSTVRAWQTATTLVMQKCGSVGMEQCISSGLLKGLRQVCEDLISAKLFLMLRKQWLEMSGRRNLSLLWRKEQQKKAVDQGGLGQGESNIQDTNNSLIILAYLAMPQYCPSQTYQLAQDTINKPDGCLRRVV